MGRPSDYTKEIALEICERIADGESLIEICREEAMPHRSTVMRWVKDNREGFCDNYAQAREMQADYYAYQILDVARGAIGVAGGENGGACVQAKRLEVDALKWHASKLAPVKYGTKIAQEISGPNGSPIEQATSIIVTPELESKILKVKGVSDGMNKPEGIS